MLALALSLEAIGTTGRGSGGDTVPLSSYDLGLKFTTAEYYWSDYWAEHALALRFKVPEYYA